MNLCASCHIARSDGSTSIVEKSNCSIGTGMSFSDSGLFSVRLVIRKRYHVAWVDIERDFGLLVRALEYLCGPPNRHPVGVHVDNERCVRLGVEAEKFAMSPWW